MKLVIVALVGIGLAGCQTNSEYYGQLAAAVGQTINAPKTDAEVKRYSDKIAKYCSEIQLGATTLDLLAPAKAAQVTDIARTTIRDFCNKPPQNLSDALVILARTATLIQNARKEAKV